MNGAESGNRNLCFKDKQRAGKGALQRITRPSCCETGPRSGCVAAEILVKRLAAEDGPG